MRSIHLLFSILFGLFYILISLGTIKAVNQLFSKRNKKYIISSILFFSVSIFLSLLLLYIWPGTIRTAKNYNFYFFINSILSIDLVFKVPLALFYFFGLFIRKNEIQKTFGFAGLIISVCLTLFVIYGLAFGSGRIVTKHVELSFKNLPPNFDGYKIVQISDIHLGSLNHSHKLLKNIETRIEEINPDILFFTGDLVNNYSSELDGWAPVFKEMTKNRKSFSILGNHDYGNYSDWQSKQAKSKNFERITNSHKKFGFTLLRNEHVVVTKDTDSIYVIGVENWGHPPFPQYANLEKALSGIPNSAFKILLTHDPAHWESQVAGKKPVNLTLAGHTHGFQFGIIKAGIPFSLAWFTRKEWGGLYNKHNVYLYVNTGLGTIGFPRRINMPPEVTVITLKRIEVD